MSPPRGAQHLPCGSQVAAFLRFQAKREQLERFKGLLPESQGQNVLYAPYSLDRGWGLRSGPDVKTKHLQGYLAHKKTPTPLGPP